jgi:uncharacterized protein (DUF885 family)
VPDHPVFGLADRFVDGMAAVRPVEATRVGVGGHDHEWGDLGPGGLEAAKRLVRSTGAELAAMPEPEDRFSQLAVRVLRERLDGELIAFEHDDALADVTHLDSTIPDMLEALAVQDVTEPDGREAMLERLETLPDALADWRERIALAIDREVLVPVRQAESVIAQLRASVSEGGSYQRHAIGLAELDPRLAVRAQAGLAGVRAASETTARMLEQRYLPRAPTADGVGPERYVRHARHHLGMDLDVDAYAWGWQELGRLLKRAATCAAKLDPPSDLPQAVLRLRTDPAFAAPTHAVFQQLMQERQEYAIELLAGTHFDVPEEIRRIDVRVSVGEGVLGVWYFEPSEDLRRPGSIRWLLGPDGPVPLFEEVSTAYHEGFPGHHLQIASTRLLSDRLSRAHRLFLGPTAYVEGWALYAETLMGELGFLEEPHYELGHLTTAVLRALRVSMDIGLHLGLRIPDEAPLHGGQPWSFEVAVDLLERLCGLGHAYAVSEVTRYLGSPGQAISYALGQRAILDLRADRRARDGAAFDLARFHADVLGSGPVGLEHLRELVLA